MWWIVLIVAVVLLLLLVCGALASAASEADRITEELNQMFDETEDEIDW